MQWMAPMTALYAAAVAVPALILMYFLKLTRRTQDVSSTLLWRRAVRDLQVNAPFQRLRRNLLMLLQLLGLLVIVAALGQPVLSFRAGRGRRCVILIDRSGSMQATDVTPSRLEHAKHQAAELVRGLRGRSTFGLDDRSDKAMVVAFDSRADVMCGFTADKQQLLSAIRDIEAGDGGSSLAEAMSVAQAFALPPGAEANNRSSEDPARVVIFSDGRLGGLDDVVLRAAEPEFHAIGTAAENVAIVAMQARRSYERPEQVEVFVRLHNYGKQAVDCDVQLSADGAIRAVRSLRLGAVAEDEHGQIVPGTASATFSLAIEGGAVLEVRQLREDLLSADDAAWAVVPPPRRLSVLLVSAGNPALEMALRACPLADLETRTPEQFDAMDYETLAARQPFDVVVLDNHAPAGLPRGQYLVFGRPPPDVGVEVGGEVQGQVMIDWRRRHSVLQYVDLANVFVARACRLSLPRDAEVLAEFAEGPAIAVTHRRGRSMLLVSFDPLASNWPFESGFVMFCYNAVHFLGAETGPAKQQTSRVAQPIVLQGLPPRAPVHIKGPETVEQDLQADETGGLRFAGTDKAGVYQVAVADGPAVPFAVNMLDARESDITPTEKIDLPGRELPAQTRGSLRGEAPLWPMLVLAALLLVCLEWWVYNSRIRL